MKRKQGIALLLALIVTVAVIWSAIGSMAEDRLATVWIMCKPGSYVSIREKPDKKSGERGYLDSGDSFQTTGESKDGWIRCCGAGEGGWVVSRRQARVRTDGSGAAGPGKAAGSGAGTW